MAAKLPGKTATDVRKHYEDLVEDVTCIEAGRVALPTYSNSSCSLEWLAEKSGAMQGLKQQFGSGGRGQSTKASEQERKKGVPWTEEEHRYSSLLQRKFEENLCFYQ